MELSLSLFLFLFTLSSFSLNVIERFILCSSIYCEQSSIDVHRTTRLFSPRKLSIDLISFFRFLYTQRLYKNTSDTTHNCTSFDKFRLTLKSLTREFINWISIFCFIFSFSLLSFFYVSRRDIYKNIQFFLFIGNLKEFDIDVFICESS